MVDAMTEPNGLYQPPDSELKAGAKTEEYGVIPYGPMLGYLNRPYFTLSQAEAMLWDHQVWYALQLGNAPLIQGKVEVKSDSKEVAQFVQAQWDKLWDRCASKMMQNRYFGWAGFE